MNSLIRLMTKELWLIMKTVIVDQFILQLKTKRYYGSLSSKVDKYKKIIEKKVKKYGSCRSIMISEIANKKSVILLQNAFPTLEKYIDHPHIINGKPLKVINTLKNEILDNFKYMMALKQEGRNLFFTNIDAIKEKMLEELK